VFQFVFSKIIYSIRPYRFLMVAYVYLAFAIALFVLRTVLRGLIDLVGWSNAFGLRSAIARERGIAAYRAWVPFERIRPA
jgi:hypothetical protein